MNLSGAWQVETSGGLSFRGSNLVVQTGRNLITSRAAEDVPPAWAKWLGVGDGNATPGLSDVSLGNEFARSQGTFNSFLASNNQIVHSMIGVGPSGVDWTVREMGWFNDPTVGTMLARWTMPTFTVADGETLAVTWTLTVGA